QTILIPSRSPTAHTAKLHPTISSSPDLRTTYEQSHARSHELPISSPGCSCPCQHAEEFLGRLSLPSSPSHHKQILGRLRCGAWVAGRGCRSMTRNSLRLSEWRRMRTLY